MPSILVQWYLGFFNRNSELISERVVIDSYKTNFDWKEPSVVGGTSGGVAVGSTLEVLCENTSSTVQINLSITVPETTESTLQLSIFYASDTGGDSGSYIVKSTVSVPILVNGIQSQIDRLTTAKASIATAITNKGVTVPSGTKLDGMAALIDSISGGGGSVVIPGASDKDVNFRDYDGTILYSYTKDEALSLTSLPDLPTQDGLICQGWNWSFEKMQRYVGKYGKIEIGATYITDDGKTRIYITMQEGRTSPMLGVCPNGTVTVDWGDGTTPDVLTGTSESTVKWTPTHNYASAGDYVIELTVDGKMGLYGSYSSTNGAGILRYSSSSDYINHAYGNAVQKIEIGSGVTSIGANAFRNLPNLTSVTIPEGVTSIESYAFQQCYILTSVTIPESVTSIKSYAFSYCYNLQSIVIPDGVTSIGVFAFIQCLSLASITIPESVTSIGGSVFNQCYILTSITIPEGVTSIGNSAFTQCYSLTSVTIPESVTSIGGSVFYQCYSLTSVTIPEGVTSIGANAFYQCYILTSVTIPESVTSIGGSAFQQCYILTSIVIPDGVTSIGGYAFQQCLSLASITIPESVTSIGANAFNQCYSLGKVRFNGATPPAVSSSNAFTNIPTDCIISVPVGALSAYTSATNYPSSSTYTYIEED